MQPRSRLRLIRREFRSLVSLNCALSSQPRRFLQQPRSLRCVSSLRINAPSIFDNSGHLQEILSSFRNYQHWNASFGSPFQAFQVERVARSHGSRTIARTVSMSVDRISSVLERLEWLVVLCLPRGKWTQNVEHIPPPSGGYLVTPPSLPCV